MDGQGIASVDRRQNRGRGKAPVACSGDPGPGERRASGRQLAVLRMGSRGVDMRPPEHPPGDIFVSRSLTHRLLSIITAQSGKCSAQRQPREPAPRRARLRQDCLVKMHGWKVSAAMDIVPPKRGRRHLHGWWAMELPSWPSFPSTGPCNEPQAREMMAVIVFGRAVLPLFSFGKSS